MPSQMQFVDSNSEVGERLLHLLLYKEVVVTIQSSVSE